MKTVNKKRNIDTLLELANKHKRMDAFERREQIIDKAIFHGLVFLGWILIIIWVKTYCT